MFTKIASFNIDLRANTGNLTRGLDRGIGSVKGFSFNVGNALSGLGKFAAVGAGVGVAVAGISKAFDTATSAVSKFYDKVVLGGIEAGASFEQQQVAFDVMLGGLENANSLLADLTQFAAETPFQFDELTDASKKLVAFNVAQKDIVPTMRRLGDIAAGLGIPIGELAELYGKAKVQGRLFAQDVNQLTGRGIPVIQEFAKQFGVADGAVRKLVESGQLNFGHLEQAFKDLTSEGGKFAGLMQRQSQTTLGLWSTFKDNLSLTLRDIGTALIEEFNLKGWLKSTADALSEFKSLVSASVPVVLDEIAGIADALFDIDFSARGFVNGLATVVAYWADVLRDFRKQVLGVKELFGDLAASRELAALRAEPMPGTKIFERLKELRNAVAAPPAPSSIPTPGLGIANSMADFLTGLAIDHALQLKNALAPAVESVSTIDDRVNPGAVTHRTVEAFSQALRNVERQNRPTTKDNQERLLEREIAATNEVRNEIRRLPERLPFRMAVLSG